MGRITGARGDVVIRQPSFVDTEADDDNAVMALVANELINLTSKTIDLSRPVDEYQSVGAATSLEVLPEYELEEIINCIAISGNETYGVPNGIPATTTGTSVANPGNLTTLTSQTLAPGTYLVHWTCMVAAGTSAADDDNFRLLNGAATVADSVNGHVAGTTYTQADQTIVVLQPGAVVAIKDIAQPGNTATYTGTLTCTLIAPTTPTSVTAVNTTAANPAAGTTVTAQALAAGTYAVGWTVQLGGTTTAADINNFGLYLGSTLLAVSLSGSTVGTPYPQPNATVVVPAAGATLAVKNIAQPGNVPTYTALICITAVPNPNIVTLQLGRRTWYVDLAKSGGIAVLNNLGLRLNRNERRIITQTVAGPLSLELTGHADMMSANG